MSMSMPGSKLWGRTAAVRHVLFVVHGFAGLMVTVRELLSLDGAWWIASEINEWWTWVVAVVEWWQVR